MFEDDELELYWLSQKPLEFSANDFSEFSSFVVLRIEARVSGILAGAVP